MYALIQKTYIQSLYGMQVPLLFHFFCLMYITEEAQFLALKLKHVSIFIQWPEAIDDV